MDEYERDYAHITEHGISFAKHCLERYQYLSPFGYGVAMDGVLRPEAVDPGPDPVGLLPKEQLNDLVHGFEVDALAGRIRSCGVFYDTTFEPPDTGEISDALGIILDNRSKRAIKVFFPYRFDGDLIIFRDSFTLISDTRVFS